MGGIQSANAGRENNAESIDNSSAQLVGEASVHSTPQLDHGPTRELETVTTVAAEAEASVVLLVDTKRQHTSTATDDCETTTTKGCDDKVNETSATELAKPVHQECLAEPVEDEQGEESDDSMSEKCRARKMTTELAAFRQQLQQKRGIHQSKLGQVRQELEQLRAALAEEKSRNRALIKYIQQQADCSSHSDAPTTPAAVLGPAGVDDSFSSMNHHLAAKETDPSSALEVKNEQSDVAIGSTVDIAQPETRSVHDDVDDDVARGDRERSAGEAQSNDQRQPAASCELRSDDRSDNDTSTTTTNETNNNESNSSSSNRIQSDDVRRALKRELAESQHELQRVTGETLALRHDLAQLRTQLHALQDDTLAESSRQNGVIRGLKSELAESQFQLQIAQAEALSLQTDVGQLRNQVKTLKDVIKAGKEIIAIREDQVEQLKGKLRQIEDTLQERELQIMSDDLRREYDRQLTNIRNLRDLYEERERVSRMERDNLLRQLDLKKSELGTEQEKNKNLEALVESLQSDLTQLRAEHEQTQEKLSLSQAQTRQLQLEMGVVNEFISKFLLGMSRKPTANDINIDKLAAMLEENRALLIEMTKDEAETVDTGAFLPRALYDLIAEVDEANESAAGSEASGSGGDAIVLPSAATKTETETAAVEGDGEESGDEFTDVQKASPEQIADKLPKVWRVLIELVNHQERAQPVPFVEGGESEECLQSVQTSRGPKTVVSVSKTYIKLKDLILEKKALKKETNRLKTLNVHLERRLDTQEKRLSAVSLELTKTWHLVGKMQRQHRQLHTQEQILRYHLQQKRRLLSELKEELERCRVKWSAARQKNIESEDQWKSLKADFVARRKLDSQNNSGESGYSDEQPSEDDDDDDNGGAVARSSRVAAPVARAAHERKLMTVDELLTHTPFDKQQFPSSGSLTNLYQVAIATLRKVHSESDMKSLDNVERANRFCNEKIEDLPLFAVDELEVTVSEGTEVAAGAAGTEATAASSSSSDVTPARKTTKSAGPAKRGKKKRKGNTGSGPESAQDMFLRLMNIGQPELPEEQDDDPDQQQDDQEADDLEEDEDEYDGTGNDNAEAEYSVNESASELEEESLEQAASLEVTTRRPEPPVSELSSEELFQQKREARLLRMAELNSRLDRYSSPAPASTTDERSPPPAPPSDAASERQPAEEAPAARSVAVLSEEEEKYLQRRAERLERLEREAQEFRNRLSRTVHRGTEIAAQIDEIHNGFVARQTESPMSGPVAGPSGLGSSRHNTQQPSSAQSTVQPVPALPIVELTCLSEREREYTAARAERLQRLESESEGLLRKMNQTMRRGTSLTTRLDMLHSRYGQSGPADTSGAAAADVDSNLSDPSTPGTQDHPGVGEGEGETLPEDNHSTATGDSPELPTTNEPAVTIDRPPFMAFGPVELVLVSDEEEEEQEDDVAGSQ
ncbi:myosin-14 [Anopheles aquasalis]|uniref:myosin-14 n=1 Tax=Anopheles aquasalis TaxID=42839 RepID=UPI00215B1037|nr:myosin-14 [Anopheles aquasalis]XP_050082710.1 myosin-14 [Anopheles aquasalis]